MKKKFVMAIAALSVLFSTQIGSAAEKLNKLQHRQGILNPLAPYSRNRLHVLSGITNPS